MAILRKISIFALTLVFAISIFSCKAEIDTSSQNKDENTSKTPVTDIKLDKTQLTLLIGKSETLTATVSPENATNKSITWKSSAPNIAKVENGKITALAEGNATITVTTEDGGKTASCTVSVIEDGIILTFKDGDTILTTLNGKKGSEISAPPVPTKTGYKFKNWEPALPEKFPATDTTYKATWTANKYTIKFDANGGTGTPMDDLSLVYDEPHELPQNIFSKEGYEFIGWSKNPDTPKEFDDKSEIINLSSEDNAVVTLYAKWIREGDYTINYVLNDGTNNPTNPDSYNIESDTIVLGEPTKLECVFEGWFADSAFTNKITQIEKGSTGNITLYAKWTYITYSITYELNGGTNNSNNPDSYNIENETIVLGEPTKNNYAFEGWFTDSDFTNQITQIEKGSTGNITIYAKWDILSMSFEKTSYVLVAGKSETLKLTIPPEEYDKITWTSSNTSAASVDEKGKVTANPDYDSAFPSEVKITAKYNKIEKTCTVKVISKTLTKTTIERLCNTKIKEFEIPDGITSIESFAFSSRKNLTSITIPSSMTSISKYSFGSSGLTSITIPDSVTSIGQNAFEGCTSLTSITIPDSVTSIGNYAFSGCTNLTNITIPDSVTSIGAAPFYGCTNLTSITIPDSISSTGGIFSGTGLKSITIPNTEISIGDYAFKGCSSLTSITIPDSVTSIGQNAFEGCTSLTSITIPDSVTSIGDYAFRNCTSLNSITIPDGVTSIGDYAFWNCTNLTNITIPDSVTSIGGYAFKGCTSLTSITIPCNMTDINSHYVFFDSSISSITLQQGMLSIGRTAFSDCTNLTSITIPDSVTSIGEYAFYNCTNLSSITIPDSVTSIGDYAFYGCTSLTSITIPDGVTSISNYTFYGCTNLTSITIPDSVTSIGEYAFYKCTNLSSITIPDSVTSIGDLSFFGCNSLTSITIPNSMTYIDAGAFQSCRNLTSITIPSSVTYIGNGALFFCSKLTTVHFDDTNNWKYKTENETTNDFEFVNTAVFVNDTQNALNLRGETGCVQDWSYGMQKN